MKVAQDKYLFVILENFGFSLTTMSTLACMDTDNTATLRTSPFLCFIVQKLIHSIFLYLDKIIYQRFF